jgi:hypothetical protein
MKLFISKAIDVDKNNVRATTRVAHDNFRATTRVAPTER